MYPAGEEGLASAETMARGDRPLAGLDAPEPGLSAGRDVPPLDCRPTSNGEGTMSFPVWPGNLRTALAPGQGQSHPQR
jgi:hypothetical protein